MFASPASRSVHRRDFLKVLGAAGVGMLIGTPRPLWGKLAGDGPQRASLKVTDVERITVNVPFRETPARHMAREIPYWTYSEICKVTLASGTVGVGETLIYYTWGRTTDDDVKSVLGKNAAEVMWKDSLGAGLQMALFDAVARWAEVPLHSLLGTRVYQTTPLSWWNIDTTTEDLVAECKLAWKQGYRSYKTKGRPWFDVWAQVKAVSEALPKEFHLDMDFNETLLDAERAIPILKELEVYPQFDINESPIPQADVAGNQRIHRETRPAVALHYGTPPAKVAIGQDVCDGFVVGGGATRLLNINAVTAIADLPVWLQLVGTDITAAYSLHFGGVMSQARWPAVNCHQLYQDHLLTRKIEVKDGHAAVPEGIGLGYDIDWNKVEKYRVETPTERPNPQRLIETTWPNGRRMYLSNTREVNFMLNAGRLGKLPFFEHGVETRILPNDGSKEWLELYTRGQQGAVILEP